MKLVTYTIEKQLLTKTTLKSQTGSYNSDENGAKVIMTFEGDINTDKANEQANIEVRKLLNWSEGSDFLNQTTQKEEGDK
jgi:hypothetical protein